MRIVLAEDSVLLREGLVRLLVDEGHEVLAAVGDAGALLAETERHQPDVVVTDVRMPPGHTDEGVRAALEIRRRWPGVGVLLLSQYVETRLATDLITGDAGGVGYLLKDRVVQVDEFLDGLGRVGAGGMAIDAEVVRRLLSRASDANPLTRLTARELEVLTKMAHGHNNAGIAAAMHISQSAVEKHVNTIFEKLELTRSAGFNRRVLAIMRYLRDVDETAGPPRR